MPAERLSILFEKFWSKTSTPAEKTELAELLLSKQPENQQRINELLEEVWLKSGSETDMDALAARSSLQRILASETSYAKRGTHRDKSISNSWWAIAASVIVVIGLSLYFFAGNNKKEAHVAINQPAKLQAPSFNRAMIMLADGTKIFLDSAGNGQLAKMGSVTVVKLANGRIAYQTADGKVSEELQYNTLTNPRGSKVIDLELSDGTHVWLNAGSSIRYPVAFIDKAMDGVMGERRVELEGEGYFEVAKDPLRKFIVKTNETETEVLGTHFNVRAYNNEPGVRVTLLEGSVFVKAKTGSLKIKPGEQARVTASGVNRRAADIDQVMAWKDEHFNFDNMNLKEVMQELERWYEIHVVYEGKERTITFGGNVNRSISLNDVLMILEKSGLKYSWDLSKRQLKVFY